MTAAGPPLTGLGAHVAEAFVRAKEAMRPHDRAHADERLTTWLDRFEAELAPRLEPFLASIRDDPETPAPVRELFDAATAPAHAVDVTLIIGLIGALAYPLISAVLAADVQAVQSLAWRNNPNVPLSPADAALMVLKHTDFNFNPYDEAKQWGINPNRLDTMVANIEEPPAIAEMLLLLRRGQIDATIMQEAVRKSRVGDRWLPQILQLRYAPPGAGAVIEGRVKNWLDDATAIQKFAEAGLDPVNFDWMHKAAGRPPGVESMLQLWNRHLAGDPRASVDETVVNDVIHQSDINDRFLPYVKELRTYIPPPRSIVPMLRSGAITPARALQLLEMHGLSAQDAQAFVTEATTTKATAGKQLTQAQVVRMYEAGFLTRGDASNRLAITGHPADEIALLLDFADQSRREKLANALISKVGSLYTAHKIDRSAATNALNGDSIPQATQADLFHVWDLERAAMVHHPTPSQVVGAYRRGEISALDCKTRLTNLGVQLADLGIIVADGYPPTKGAEAKAAALAVTSA